MQCLIVVPVVGLVALNVGLSTLWQRQKPAAQWLWAGAVTPTSFQLRVKGQGHLVVSHGEGTEGRVFSRQLLGHGVHNLTVEGLQPETEYFYGLVDDASQTPQDSGRVKTWAAAVQQSLRVAAASCATVESNDGVFGEIADAKYDLFLQMGDLHYHDIQVNDTQLYRDAFALVHGAPQQRRLFRSAPVAYVWDDHDFGGNDMGADAPSAGAAREAFRESVPKPEVAGRPLAAYHAFSVGRVRFVMVDARSESMPGGSIMSDEQMEWLLGEIASAGAHKLLVLMLGQPWIGAEDRGGDGWLGHVRDRKRISDAIAAAKGTGGYASVVGVAGDAHMLVFDDGTHTDYSSAGGAGFPLLQAGPMHRSGSAKGGPYTTDCLAYKLANNHQYGSLEITDTGADDPSAVCVKFGLHRGGGSLLHSQQMCGPLLGSRASADVTCSIPLLPVMDLCLLVFVLLSLAAEIALAVHLQLRGQAQHKMLGWSAVGLSLLSAVPQVVLFVVAKATQLPMDDPWRPLLFQSIIQLMLALMLIMVTLFQMHDATETCSHDLVPDKASGPEHEVAIQMMLGTPAKE